MANLCSAQRPASMTDSAWSDFMYWQIQNSFNSGIRGSSPSVPYLFDADQFYISCVAFANNGSAGTLLSYQTQINQLQASLTATQEQLTAVLAGSHTAPPNPEQINAMGVLFGVVLTVAATIYGVKRLLALFSSHPDS